MAKIAIIVAMKSEFNLVSHVITNATDTVINGITCRKGTMHSHDVILMQCGIGKVNAAVQTAELINTEHPDYIINSGVAGGIGKGLQPGNVVVADRCCYHDVWCGDGEWGQVQGLPLYFTSSETLVRIASQLDNDQLHIGLICTGDQFISDLDQLNKIKGTFPEALAVDMESAAIAHVCHQRNTPFLSLRVVSDTPGMEIDNAAQYFDFMTDAPKRTFGILEELIKHL